MLGLSYGRGCAFWTQYFLWPVRDPRASNYTGVRTRSTMIEVYLFLSEMISERRGFLSKNRLKIHHFFGTFLLVVCIPRLWDFSSAIKQVYFFFSKSVFGLRRTCLNLLK